MLPGPVSKATTASGPRSGRNRSQIRDAADILQNPPALVIREKDIIEQRNQRRSLAAGQHVGRPKVRNHRNAERGSNRLRLARLPRARKLPARIRLLRAPGGRASARGSQPDRASPCACRAVSFTASAYARPSRQFSRASSAVEVDCAFIAASTARRSAAGKRSASCASSVSFGFDFPGAIRTTATSIPSADVPLITPATVIALAFMRRLRPLAHRHRLAEPQNPRPQRLKLLRCSAPAPSPLETPSPASARSRAPARASTRLKRRRPLAFARSVPHTRCKIGSA